MSINVSKFALAGAIVAALAFLLCSLVVAIAPDLAARLLGWLFHIITVQQTSLNPQLTWSGMVGGAVQSLVYAYLSFGLFAWLYNRLINK